jgi:hypothetical protein
MCARMEFQLDEWSPSQRLSLDHLGDLQGEGVLVKPVVQAAHSGCRQGVHRCVYDSRNFPVQANGKS